MNKKVLYMSVFVLILTPSILFSADEPFVYDAHEKHDPFNPLVTPTGSVQIYDADLTAFDMTLEGILEDPEGNSAAIINGKILKIGEQIGPYLIQSIGSDHVIILKDGEGFTLNIKKGG